MCVGFENWILRDGIEELDDQAWKLYRKIGNN